MERRPTATQLKDMIYDLGRAIPDAEKFDAGGAGSDAAGTRARKAMQAAKKQAQEIRETVSDVKAGRVPDSTEAPAA